MSSEPPLDEIQWRDPYLVFQLGGIHSNTILFYFAKSPFFDNTSNNAVLWNQAHFNASMHHILSTRDAFEARLRTMSGLEFVVAQEPAEMAHGYGTGVWVIRKQTRRKRPGEDYDDVTVHASYFVVGENVYMAPTLADILSARIEHMGAILEKALPAADKARKWTPSGRNTYIMPTSTAALPTKPAKSATAASRDDTPALDVSTSMMSAATTASTAAPPPPPSASDRAALDRLALESFATHIKYGGDYIDENPITGRPGDFHFASTGRKAVPAVTAGGLGARAAAAGGIGALGTAAPPGSGIGVVGPNGQQLPAINTKLAEEAAAAKREGGANKGDKTPKTPTTGGGKLKRRKSKLNTQAG